MCFYLLSVAESPEGGHEAEEAEQDPLARTASAGAGRLQEDSNSCPAHSTRALQARGSESALYTVARCEPRLSVLDTSCVSHLGGQGWTSSTRRRYHSL